jgi:endonuclease/exonuclease/phosphatase family metal-dependent hydrolase
MKELSLFNKVVFTINLLLVTVTVFGYILPFLAPNFFPILSVFTLFLPALLIANLFFFLYWLLLLKKQSIYSLFILLIGITYINKFYKLNPNALDKSENEITIMSYNVRLFNLYKWIKNDSINQNISAFIKEKNPDIISIQEFSEQNKVDFKLYPEKFIFVEGKNTLLGHAIYSKFPIINDGKINFENSTSNAAFVDIKRGLDTIRIYSLHLESIKITPDVHELDKQPEQLSQEKAKYLLKRLSDSFVVQHRQAEIIKNHKNQCKYPTIVTGDINNSAFSYVYRIIKGENVDAFEEAGKGFGKTYNVKHYPLRIDYILADKNKFEVAEFNSYSDFVASDHFPIVACLKIK